MTIAWFQCDSGASGDMLLGALLDAGADLAQVQAAVDAVGTEPVRLEPVPVVRAGLAATWVRVHTAAPASSRTWADVRAMLTAADLAEPVRGTALDCFARLARAEARAHRSTPEQVHFHEVGALDAIADIVGFSAALHALRVTAATATPVALGHGQVRTAHGTLPVPAPAVVELLTEAGAPVLPGDAPFELCTPTGAALLATVVTGWGGVPAGRIVGSGTGAGSRDPQDRPNVVRALLVSPSESGTAAGGPAEDELVLQTNVDDLDPRLWPGVLARLLEAGADDAWLTPVLMKKGRPAHTLSALVPPRAADAVRRAIFEQTSAIGLREHLVGKRALARSLVSVRVGQDQVRVKTAALDGTVVNAQPEFDDVLAVAERTGRPVKAVLAEALAAAQAAGLLP